MNPYGFVRFGDKGDREQPITHERFVDLSGRLICHLTARTHLFIPKTQDRADKNVHQRLELLRAADGTPLFPGSSLKGVIRSVAEAISGSCLTLPLGRNGDVTYRQDKYKIPRGFESCRGGDNLCPACRLFGSLGEEPFLGKVSLSDARAISGVVVEWILIEALMEPKPRHRVWYGDPARREFMRGRKFYYHRPLGPRRATQATQYNKTVEAIKPGAVLEFEVEYANLTDAELGLLVMALNLEPGMCHKVGMGKPIGLGSAEIEIIAWEQIARQERYANFASAPVDLRGEELAIEVERWRRVYDREYAQWKDSLADLKSIWTWNPNQVEDVRYPGQEWFRTHKTAKIEEAP